MLCLQVNYKNVMKQYGLGPNGGILTASNLFATRFDQVSPAAATVAAASVTAAAAAVSAATATAAAASVTAAAGASLATGAMHEGLAVSHSHNVISKRSQQCSNTVVRCLTVLLCC
jgi:hypothetical protein